MRLRFPTISWNACLLFAVGMLCGLLAQPLWRHVLMFTTQERFAELTYRCDQAMRDHLIAKQDLALRPNLEKVNVLKSAEVALIDCQDYDLLRKELIFWGLRENELALMGLRSIEAKGKDLKKVIEIHEIRY